MNLTEDAIQHQHMVIMKMKAVMLEPSSVMLTIQLKFNVDGSKVNLELSQIMKRESESITDNADSLPMEVF